MDNNYRQQMYRRNRNQYHQNNQNQQSCPEPETSCPYNGIDRMPLAMAYVPWQKWNQTYDPCKALEIGTIFPELNLPYLGRSCI